MKLFQYENPVSGKTDNVFDLQGLWSKILGVIMLFIVFATGQNIAKLVSSKLPFVDTTVEPLVNRPVTNTTPGNARVIY